MARIVALDPGEQRIGMAISDPTGTLARPFGVVRTPGLGRAAAAAVSDELARISAEPDGLALVVVGRPTRLDGTPGVLTARVDRFAGRLRQRLTVPVVLRDERLSSREAESRLALRDTAWRTRKARLDAAAAAVILQDYLDEQRQRGAAAPDESL